MVRHSKMDISAMVHFNSSTALMKDFVQRGEAFQNGHANEAFQNEHFSSGASQFFDSVACNNDDESEEKDNQEKDKSKRNMSEWTMRNDIVSLHLQCEQQPE